MEFRSSPAAFAFILFTCVSRLSHSSVGAVCLPTWSSYYMRLSSGGTPQNINDLTDCLEFCRFSSGCVAVEFDSSPVLATARCWTHTDVNDLSDDNIYTRSDITQYVIDRDCGNSSLSGVNNCQLTWIRLPGIHSINADGKSYWTEFDCFTYCRLTADCVAADFDIGSAPPCWIHTSVDDITPENTYDDSKTVVQYRLNRTCPAPVHSSFQLGQCVGYPMKSGNWCSSSEEIHIVKASYKTHPLCCHSPGTGDLLDVPDSAALLELDVFLQTDDLYKRNVEACEGQTACDLTAKAFESPYVNNVFCPTRSDKTDYVSISYTCLQKGHSDASTSTQTTRDRPILLSSLGTHLISSSSPPGSASDTSVSIPLSNSYNSNQSNNRDALILGGFGVALGGLAVITLIVLGVCWYLRYERNAGDTYNMAMNPMYANSRNNNNNNNNGSVISNDTLNQNHYGQMKGVSTAAMYPEADILSP